ncbi:MAG TPA: 3-deoxy-7-phosphoheptulonate synthase, partial [Dokdonella sp.]
MSSIERNILPVREAAGWSPSSWQGKPQAQQPVYADRAELAGALERLQQLPPLVTSWEILALKQLLADAAEGRRFVLQGGDCAESFDDCTSPLISNRLKVMLQMSLVLVHGLKLPVVRIGRFAGQYAKPRSTDME